MKQISLLTIILLLALSCSEAPIIQEEPTGRIVLAEFFTNAR